MTPPRVAVAASGLGHVARGIEAWADDLGTALAGRGYPAILCKGGGTADRPFERLVPCWQREQTKTVRLVKLLPKAVGWRLGLGAPYQVEQTTFARNLLPVLRREAIDVLHVQDPIVASIVQKAFNRGKTKTKVILAHGTEEPPAFLAKLDYVQHLAPWHHEQTRLAGVDKPAWTAIPNFIDADRFSPGSSPALRAELGLPADALVVLTAAAIKRHHKRVDHLVREFALLRERRPDLPAYLVVAGGWEEETDGVIAEGKERLGDRVRFLVRFPRPRMPELYRTADVFAFASLLEMMPIALIEATASGLPCVTHPHPVMTWMTGPGGVPTDMQQPGALADALAGLLTDVGRRQSLGAAARGHCLANFARDAVVDRIVAYYRTVAGS